MNSGTKTFLRVMNVVIILVCAAAICGYFVLPLWKVTVGIKVTEGFENAILDSVPGEESELIKTALDALREGGEEMSVSADITMADSLRALFTGSTEVGREVIRRNVGQITDELTELLKKVVKPMAVKMLVNSAINQTINDAIDDSGEQVDIDEIFEKTDLSEEWLSDKTDEIFDAANSPDATVATVSDTIMDVADEVVEKLQASEEFAGAADGYAESREEIKKNIEDILSQFADEDGHIASDEVITQQLLPILSDFLSSGKIELPEGISVPGMSARPGNGMTVTLLSSTEGAPEEKTPDAEELGDAIAKFIDERIDEKTVNRITTVLEGFGVSVLIVFAFWLFLAVKALVKLFSSKNPGVRVWAPIVFGWPHFLFLFLLPTLLLINGGAFLTSFAGMTGAPTETVKGLLEGIRVSFSTCGTVSAVCALTLIVISIFYAPQRKKLSNIYG
ncbi:MAG: hypothetical protein IKX86_05465 [Clostridia bacterium]|nr:hypothetical protein [Clostridia bacterium]